MTVREVYPVLGKGHYSWITEYCPGVRHEQHEDDDVEEQHVQAAPQGGGHCLQHNPAHHHVVCIQNCSVGHKDAEKPTWVLLKNRHLEQIHYC